MPKNTIRKNKLNSRSRQAAEAIRKLDKYGIATKAHKDKLKELEKHGY